MMVRPIMDKSCYKQVNNAQIMLSWATFLNSSRKLDLKSLKLPHRSKIKSMVIKPNNKEQITSTKVRRTDPIKKENEVNH